jgi:hypothetical protein
MKSSTGILIKATGVLLLFGVLFIAYAILSFDSPPIPLAKLERLHPKMNTNDVRRLLGAPSSIFVSSNAEPRRVHWSNTIVTNATPPTVHWAYSRLLSWPIVYVYFDENGNYESHVYDH